MSDCAVLSTNGEVRYHESVTATASNDDDDDADSHATFSHPSAPAPSHSAEPGHACSESAGPPPPPSSAASAATTENNDTTGSNDDYSVSSEVPLRRSKRGKGRGASGASGQNNNGVSSDDRVPSCIVEGVEYRTGDFVYYEEPDFEYYTIGLIEEIKFSRRDKFAVLVKCFYRTHDIPETSKQSVLEREHFHTPSNSKLMNDVLSRELFASEVQETLTSKQLRGVCKVSHLSDLRTAMTTFCPTEEDNFFYVFAYNPETRRLMNTRAEIRVGNAYQASIPPFRHFPPATYRARSHRRLRCPKHCRSPGPTSARKHAPTSDPPVAVTADPCLRSDGTDGSMDQPPAPEDLLPPLSHKMVDEEAPVEAHALNASSSPVKMDETEESKSPPKLESFRTASPKSSPLAPTSSRLEHSVTDGYHHSSQRRRRLMLLRRRGCPNLVDPLRRRVGDRRRRGRRRRRRRWEMMVWKPQGLNKALSGQLPDPTLPNVGSELADEPLKTYLDAVRSMVAFFGFGGADDDLSSAENGLVLANLAATTQHAYDTLHQSDYSLSQALQAISYNPIVSKNTPRHWTADQVRLFAHALRLHGKDFHTIQREFFGGRNSTGLGSASAGQAASSSSSGRTRGRGGRRKATGTGSSGCTAKSAVKEEDEFKAEDGKDEACGSADDANRVGTQDSCEPVKTVKELIAFYYYWKRKGAAASSSAGTTSSVTGVAGAGACGSHSSLSLQSTSGGLASAAVNFSAAVAAAATADSHLAAGSGSTQSATTTGSQSFGSVGKKRKQTTRGNLSARASTPTSERSESAGTSLPESEAEDTADGAGAIGAPEDTQPMDCNTDPDEDGTASAKDAQDVPPSGRLRRRLCRNCDKDLSSPGEAALPAGVGQLRFLCLGCRVHLQKYGELKATSADHLSSDTLQQKNCTTDGSGNGSEIQKSRRNLNRRRRHQSRDDASVDSNTTVHQRVPTDSHGSSPTVDPHSPPRCRHASSSRPPELQSLPHQPFLSPASWSPCSYMDANQDACSRASSPHSLASWRSYSTISESVSGSQSPSSSGSSPDAASLSSGCVCSGSWSDSSSDTEPAVPPAGGSLHRHRRATTTADTAGAVRPKRRRFQSHTESTVDDHPRKPLLPSTLGVTASKSLLNPQVPDRTVAGLPCSLGTTYHFEPIVRDCASVPAVVRSRDSPGASVPSHTTVPPRPGSTPAYKGHTVSTVIVSVPGQAPQGSDTSVSIAQRLPHKIPGTHVPWPVGEHDAQSVGQEEEEVDEEEQDPDVMAILAAPPRDPIPCFIEAHQSNWSNLVRTWDRSAQIILPDPNHRVLHDPGTCARTDLIYLGRRRAAEDKDRWQRERQELYARHADTAVGPGSIGLSTAMGTVTNVASDRSRTTALSPPHSPHSEVPGAMVFRPTASSQCAVTAYDSAVNTASGYPYQYTGTGSNHNINNNSNNVALDLCARPASSHSPIINNSRMGAHSVHNLTSTTSTSGNRSRRGSATSHLTGSTGVRHTPSHSPSPRTTVGTQLVGAYDPSHTQHHIQAAYEQAMMLAAAASHYHHHQQPQQQQQQHMINQQSTAAPLRDTSKSSTTSSANRSVSSATPNTTKTMAHTMPSRLGAAAGTFFPPPLVTSTAAVGFPASSMDYRVPTSQPFCSTQSVSSAMGIPPMYHHLSHSSTGMTPTYPSFTQPSAVPSSSDAAFKTPELLQRQLALMRFLPPEHALLNALDPREAEALRRFMTEKLAHFRGPAPTTHATLSPHEHQQILFQQQQQQQQELLAAAAAAELMMRRNDHANMAAHPYQNPANFPLLPTNCGAMTSAVNTITTRPTASVQMPHPFRYPAGTQTPPVSHAPPPRSADGAALHHSNPHSHHHHHQQPPHANPPAAHHNSGQRTVTAAAAAAAAAAGTTSFSSTANYLSLLAGGTASTANSRGLLPVAASPGPGGSGNSNQAANSSGPGGTNGATNSTAQQLQEQMMHAAKFAMLAANMQGDPGKALTFANMAAVAFAELAAAHEKCQTQPSPVQYGSHAPSNTARGTPTGPTPQPSPFDFRNHPNTLLQPHLSDNLAAAVAAAASANTNLQSFPAPSHTDRRRSVPSTGVVSMSSSSNSSTVGLMTAIPSESMSVTATHRLSSVVSPLTSSGYTAPRLTVPGGPGNRFAGPPLPSNVPSPSQLAQFAQLAQQSAAAGFTQGFSLQDPAMLNALMLAAAAAHAANPNQLDLNNPFFGRENEFNERQRLQQLGMGQRSLGPTSHQQQTAAAAAAAAAAFASAGLPPLNLGGRLPSSHS